MNINWKLRLKNKTVLFSLLTAIIGFVYQVLGIIGLTIPVTEDSVMNGVGMFLNLLVILGIIVDPTTSGIGDSEKVLGYDEPRKEISDDSIR